MTGYSGVNARSTEVGQLLAKVVGEAESVSADSEDWADRVRTVRDAYLAVKRADPGDLEAAVGLAVLSGVELRVHLADHVDKLWAEDHWKPATEVPADDQVGRALVDEALRTARHVLSLDPDNKLAVYLEGMAHECGGAYDEALSRDRGTQPRPGTRLGHRRVLRPSGRRAGPEHLRPGSAIKRARPVRRHAANALGNAHGGLDRLGPRRGAARDAPAAGQPVRIDGRTHFDGEHEPVEE